MNLSQAIFKRAQICAKRGHIFEAKQTKTADLQGRLSFLPSRFQLRNHVFSVHEFFRTIERKQPGTRSASRRDLLMLD